MRVLCVGLCESNGISAGSEACKVATLSTLKVGTAVGNRGSWLSRLYRLIGSSNRKDFNSQIELFFDDRPNPSRFVDIFNNV